jgi:hypothetical protein
LPVRITIALLAALTAGAFAPQAAGAQALYTGTGGRGTTLAVLAPAGKGNLPIDGWLLSLIQSVLTADFGRYSAMTIIDRQNLDKVEREQAQSASGAYSENDYIRIGNLANAQFILTGSLTRTTSTYLFELAVTNVETGVRKATYPPTPVQIAALENLSAIHAAAAELLAQMGVSLTDAGKKALSAAADTNTVNAETALAKGMALQKSSGGKTTFESYQYFYEAQALDPNLKEAVARLSAFQTATLTPPKIDMPVLEAPSTGNIGADARSKVARYNAERANIIKQQEYYLDQLKTLRDQQNTLAQKEQEMLALLKQCDDFYCNQHPPFEICYDPALEEGDLDLRNATITLHFKIGSLPASLDAAKSIIAGLVGLADGFQTINAAFDTVQKQIARVNRIGEEEYAVTPVQGVSPRDKRNGASWSLPKWEAGQSRRFRVRAALKNEAGKIIGQTEASLSNELVSGRLLEADKAETRASFRSVKVDDLTDVLTIVITAVDGKDLAQERGYIKVQALSFENEYPFGGFNWYGFDKDGYDRSGYKNSYNRAGYDKDGYDRAGYDRTGYDRGGYNRKGYDRDGYGRDGYNVAGYDRKGYDRNGYNGYGYDKDGYDWKGFDKDGYDRNGYNRAGYDRDGYNKNGYNRAGHTASEAAEQSARRWRFLFWGGLAFLWPLGKSPSNVESHNSVVMSGSIYSPTYTYTYTVSEGTDAAIGTLFQGGIAFVPVKWLYLEANGYIGHIWSFKDAYKSIGGFDFGGGVSLFHFPSLERPKNVLFNLELGGGLSFVSHTDPAFFPDFTDSDRAIAPYLSAKIDLGGEVTYNVAIACRIAYYWRMFDTLDIMQSVPPGTTYSERPGRTDLVEWVAKEDAVVHSLFVGMVFYFMRPPKDTRKHKTTASSSQGIRDTGPAGGSVFYVNGRRMEAAPASTEFSATWSDAIARCRSLQVKGISGWHLPTKEELDAMYRQLHKQGLGGFSMNWYWSSSDNYSNVAWIQYFDDGTQYHDFKYNSNSVRAVRAF